MKKNNALPNLNQTEITEELKRLRLENAELKKLVNSKRFKFAEKIATKYNIILPANTARRKVVSYIIRSLFNASILIENLLDKKISQKLQTISKNYDKIFVISSIDWDTKLRQRPHHLA